MTAIGGRPKGDDAKKEKKTPEPSKDDAMQRKIVNDAVAYIRGLAQMRRRNADWGERSVRQGRVFGRRRPQGTCDRPCGSKCGSMSWTRSMGVRCLFTNKSRVLRTAKLDVATVEPDWRTDCSA